MLPGVLPAVDGHYRAMQRLESLAVLLVRRAWTRVDPQDVVASWDAQAARMLTVFAEMQLAAAVEGAGYVGATLEAQRIAAEREVEFVPESLVGWSSGGHPIESLIRAPASVSLAQVSEGVNAGVALEAGRVSVERIARTQIADVGRAAAGIDVAVRSRVAWVRMVNPPVCSRCLILAGRVYRWSDGFQRHPNCDCVHVATSVSAARREGLVDDPNDYFHRLSTADQDRLLTKDGAQAVRDGADMNQVVNARRGMTVAGTTTEGTTARGFAAGRLRGRTRLMPEQIYREATSRADALRLLMLHGYVI